MYFRAEILQFLINLTFRNVCVKYIGSWASMVLLNYQNVIEMTSNKIYKGAPVSRFKCPQKINLNTLYQVSSSGWTGCARKLPTS